MKILKVFAMAAIVLCLASCGTYTTSHPYSVATELDLRMNDLEFLGESEISCEYDTYLGFIKHLTKVNGKDYVPGNYTKLKAPGISPLFGKGMQTAAYDLVKKYPQGEYYQVVFETKQSDKLFLGTCVRKTARVRVYKFRPVPLMPAGCKDCCKK